MIKIVKDSEEMALSFAKYFDDLAVEYMEKNKNLFVALSGGSTPKILFRVLAEKYKNASWWKNTHFFWGDERMVPSESQESNFGEAKRILFDSISSIPSENIHNVNGENEIGYECNRYDCEIASYLPRENFLPAFDLMILGLGDDGHTASIFPNQLELIHSDGICEEATHPQSGQIRLTLTGKVINNSKNVVFLVTGKNKAEKISSIINKKGNYKEFPAAQINPESGNLIWFLDESAASTLNCK